MIDFESCVFSYEYVKNSLKDSKFLKMFIGFFKFMQVIGNKL